MSNEQIKSQAGRAVVIATADETTPCIYCYRFPNGKEYVGQTKNLKKRHDGHLYGTSNCPAFHAALEKYGWERKKLPMVLIECRTQEQLNYWEKFFIKQRKTMSPNGYNLTEGGDGSPNPSQETRDKMSQSQTGRKHSNETKNKMSQAQKGKFVSDKTREKLRQANLGKKNKPHSEETKRKIGQAHKGMKRSEETKRKMRLAWKTRKQNKTTRRQNND